MKRRKAEPIEVEDYFGFDEKSSSFDEKSSSFDDDYFAFLDDPVVVSRPEKPRKLKKRKKNKTRHKSVRLDVLPDEIPLLSKDDLLSCRSQEKGSDRHHVTVWIDLCLPADYYSSAARNKLGSAIMSLTWKHWGYNGIGPSFIPLDDQAAIWNAALRQLGYPVSPHNCIILGPRGKKEK